MQILDCDVPDWMKKTIGFLSMYSVEDRLIDQLIVRFEPQQTGRTSPELCLWIMNYDVLGQVSRYSLPSHIHSDLCGKYRYTSWVDGRRMILSNVPGLPTPLKETLGNKLRSQRGYSCDEAAGLLDGYRLTRVTEELLGGIAAS